MEPVVLVSIAASDDTALTSDINWKKCIICQENKFPKKKFPFSKAIVEGIQCVINCVNLREQSRDSSFKDALGRLKGLEGFENKVF